jgi:hypothetical protein
MPFASMKPVAIDAQRGALAPAQGCLAQGVVDRMRCAPEYGLGQPAGRIT